MKKELVIIGASGQGKVVADIALKLQKYEKIVFLDDNKETKDCMGIPVVGSSKDVEKYINQADVFVAIGNCKVREKITKELLSFGASIATLIHPMAVIANNVSIGDGTVVMAGAVINSDSKIGRGCIINTCASIDHDCNIADYVHVSVGAHICGTVMVDENTWIGAGAIIKNNISICGECMIGAGAVVVKDIEEAGTYVGMPAKQV